MSNTGWIVIAVVVVSVGLFLVMGPRLGWFELKLFGTKVRGGAREGGASADGARAKNIKVKNVGPGGASANRAVASEDLEVENKAHDGGATR